MIRKGSSGFTLIEMLIVVAIVGLLAGTAVGQYRRAVNKTRESLLRENLYIMRSQINAYVAATGEHPLDASEAQLHTLISQAYPQVESPPGVRQEILERVLAEAGATSRRRSFKIADIWPKALAPRRLWAGAALAVSLLVVLSLFVPSAPWLPGGQGVVF